MTRADLDEWRRDSESAETRRDFERSALAVAAWERAHPVGLAETLEWISALRRLFGDPPIDESPWMGHDYRL